MIADLMFLNAIIRFTVSGLLFDPVSDQEESGFNIVFRKDFEPPLGVRRIRSIVVGEGNNPLIRVQANDILSERRSKEIP